MSKTLQIWSLKQFFLQFTYIKREPEVFNGSVDTLLAIYDVQNTKKQRGERNEKIFVVLWVHLCFLLFYLGANPLIETKTNGKSLLKSSFISLQIYSALHNLLWMRKSYNLTELLPALSCYHLFLCNVLTHSFLSWLERQEIGVY